MPDQNKPFFQLGGRGWVLYALVALLIIGSIVAGGRERPAWENCKESLIVNYLTGNCTPLEGLGRTITITIPTSPGTGV